MNSVQVVLAHARAGRFFTADGVRSFVRESGPAADGGDPVVCVHGVPTSSFLFRKLVGELGAQGLRGVAFDLPGLGLAERPQHRDLSWTALGRWALAAIDALELERFHLVVHDIGGPVGFEVAAAVPDRVRSLTILNTMVEVDTFTRPWPMEPFARRGLGELWLAAMTPPAFRLLMRRTGVLGPVADAELDAYLRLLRRGDGGRAFLRIMRSFERTRAKRDLYVGALRDAPYPRQVVWGEHDPFLRLAEHGEQVRRAAGVDRVQTVPGRHFLPEDQAPAIAEHVARLARDAV